jgi:hypothetical protein
MGVLLTISCFPLSSSPFGFRYSKQNPSMKNRESSVAAAATDARGKQCKVPRFLTLQLRVEFAEVIYERIERFEAMQGHGTNYLAVWGDGYDIASGLWPTGSRPNLV